jgi:hypothetical protein
MSGWIKIHRKILDWEWYNDSNTFRLFMHLILKANHKPKKYRGVNINIGCLMTGRELLSNETGLSVQQVRTCLERLKSTNEITIKSTKQGTIIQVLNYQKYQVSTNEITEEQPQNNQQVTINKNVKNEKNNIPSVEEFVAYGVSLIEDVSIEALKLKHQSWLVNDWCKEKSGKLIKIVNWKSTLSNTISYLPKQPKQQAKSEDQIRYEHVMKQMELNK